MKMMKNVIVLMIAIMNMGCMAKNEVLEVPEQPALSCNSLHAELNEKYLMNPYHVSFALEEREGEEPLLVIGMELAMGSYYVSPFAKRDFSGKFSIHLRETEVMSLADGLQEIPRSTEIFDPHPFVNGLVNWVRVNTVYKQPLKIEAEGDFDVVGRVQFVIEPKCTMEKVNFRITRTDGVMKVQKMMEGC